MKKLVAFIVLFITVINHGHSQLETEPNNGFETADVISLTDLTATVNGAIFSTGDNDYFIVNVPRAGVFDILLNSLEGGIDGEITIFDEDEIELVDESEGGATPVYLRHLVCDPGNYYIRINDLGNNESDPDLYNLTINFDTLDIYECNNSFDEASIIPINTTLNAQINSTGDNDYYKVNVPRAGVFDLTLNSLEGGIDGEITIFDEDEIELVDESEGAAAPVYLRHLVCDPGNYYIRINDLGNNESDPDLYNLTINFDTLDIYECNNSFDEASIIPINTTLNAQINSTGDNDYYKVNVPRAGVFDILLNSLEGGIDGEITIFDEDEIELVDESEGAAAPVYLRHLVCDPGNYYIRINDLGNNESDPDLYNLTINFDTLDIYECNNSFDEASIIPINTTLNAQINSTGDNDYYQIITSKPGILNITLNSIEPPIQGVVTLFNADEIELADESEGGIEPVILNYLICNPGIYYIRVNDAGNNHSSPDLYNLTINFDTSIVYSSLEIETCSPYVSPSGNYIWTEAGIYMDTLYDASICGDSIITIHLTEPTLNLDVEQTGGTLTALATDVAYQWIDCNDDFSIIPGATDQTYLAPLEGSYAVIITEDDCSDTSACYTVDFSLVDNEKENFNLHYYPNPANNYINIFFSQPLENPLELEIINLPGQKVLSKKLIEQKTKINISTLPQGSYILHIKSGTHILFQESLTTF